MSTAWFVLIPNDSNETVIIFSVEKNLPLPQAQYESLNATVLSSVIYLRLKGSVRLLCCARNTPWLFQNKDSISQ